MDYHMELNVRPAFSTSDITRELSGFSLCPIFYVIATSTLAVPHPKSQPLLSAHTDAADLCSSFVHVNVMVHPH